MQFTPQEIRLIERLRKQERRWPQVRWALLATGAAIFACCICILVSLYSSLHFDNIPSYEVLFFAMLWPKCLVAMIGAGWLIVWPLTSWHGNVGRMLLLRILDEHEGKKGCD